MSTLFVEGDRTKAIRRELPVAGNIPYQAHISKHVISTDNNDYVQVLKLSGVSYESADDSQLNNWHNRLNNLFRSIGNSNIAVWQHVVRRRESAYPGGDFPEGFANDLNSKYERKISKEQLMVNELYLTVVYRPQPFVVGNKFMDRFRARRPDLIRQEREEAVEMLGQVVTEVKATLARYDVESLGLYQHNGIWFSEAVEFLAFLVNGEWQRMPISAAPLNLCMSTARPFFGTETIEVRQATGELYEAILGISDYPPETNSVFLNNLLMAPFEFVLSQSFSFLTRTSATGKLKRARNRMEASNDDAKTQIAEIEDALDDLTSRRFLMGDHHFSLVLKAGNQQALSVAVSEARTALSDGGIVPVREDLAMAAAYWAQLPGNFKMRPRVSAITTRNLCGFAPLHNFPSGRRTNNHWGDAAALLMTAAETGYYFSFHASDPLDPSGGSKRDIGHTLVAGPTGSGKTVLIAFFLVMMQKFGMTSVIFSKDRDTEIVIRALGGRYYPLKLGAATGWNPLWLDPTPINMAFLNRLLQRLVMKPRSLRNGVVFESEPLSSSDELKISEALASVMRLDKEHRRLGRLLDYLPKGQDSLYERLAKWCYAREPGRQDGVHAWLFDNPTDNLIHSFGDVKTTGFDVTEFLDIPELRTPINMFLFHLTNGIADGRRLGIFIAEFWKAIGDPEFSEFAKDHLKTLRKKNGFVVLDTQSLSDALEHPISRTLIEQTPTKILFPNPDADLEEHTKGASLSVREYELIKEGIAEGSRMFLLKQGHNTVVAELDLTGFDYELDVLSSRAGNIELVDELVEEYGEQPDKWLEKFREYRRKA